MINKNINNITNSDVLSLYQKSKDIYISRNIKKIKVNIPKKINNKFSPEKIIIKRQLINSNKINLREKNNFADINASERLFCPSNNKFDKIFQDLKLKNERNSQLTRMIENKSPNISKKSIKKYYIPIINIKEKDSLSLDNINIFKKYKFIRNISFNEDFSNKKILKNNISRNCLSDRNKNINYVKNKINSKLLINCRASILNKNKKENKTYDSRKKSKFLDILQKTNLIRKRLKDQIARRNKSYYIHSFNLYSPKNIDDKENNKAKETLDNFVLSSSLYLGNERKLILNNSNVQKVKIPESLKFGNNPNNYCNNKKNYKLKLTYNKINKK